MRMDYSDQTPYSIYHSSPEDAPSLDTSSAYSSPVSATTSHGGFYQAPIGLGISGLEPVFKDLSRFNFSATPLMLNQFPVAGSPYNEPSHSNNFPDASCYGLFQDVSYSPSNYYGAQGINTSPSYGPTSGVFTKAPLNWAHVAPTTPSTPEIVTSSTDCLPCWDQAYVPLNLPIENESMLLETSCYMNTPPEQTVPQRPYEAISSPATLSEHLEAHRSGEITPISPQTRKTSVSSPKPKDFFCSICGSTFTRRSNCAEHERNHDPKRKRSFSCGQCHKTFGRNADLKRHTDTIHLGIRKYHCTVCDRSFTRLDALNKHISECDHKPSPDAVQQISEVSAKSISRR